jgi:hypothetical protein
VRRELLRQFDPAFPPQDLPAPPDEGDSEARVPGPQDLVDVRVGPDLERLVAELDHAEFARREAAMIDLCDATSISQLQVYAVLARSDLSAEQRHRLMAVVRKRLLERPRGAVGINMNLELAVPGEPGPGASAVVINSVVRGMPADGHLRPRDRITHIDGEPVFRSEDLIRRVQSKLPGETIDLIVQRPIPIGEEPAAGAEGAAGPDIQREPGPQGVPGNLPPPRVETIRITLTLASTDDLETASGSAQTQGGPVVHDRQAEAAAVAEVYGPRVRMIGMKK